MFSGLAGPFAKQLFRLQVQETPQVIAAAESSFQLWKIFFFC